MASDEVRIPAKTASILVGIERYVLPLVYGYLAWQRLDYIRSQTLIYERLSAVQSHLNPHLQGLYFAGMIKHLLLFVLMVFTGVTLLLSRKPTALPDKLKHVVVPLAMSFYFILYGNVDHFPALLRESMIPEEW